MSFHIAQIELLTAYPFASAIAIQKWRLNAVLFFILHKLIMATNKLRRKGAGPNCFIPA
jgi:hypothetical protein